MRSGSHSAVFSPSPLPYLLSRLSHLPVSALRLSQMTSLIEGWFEPVNGRPYVDDSPEKGPSSRKDKSYLIVYDACAALGSLSSGVFADCEIRLWPGNQTLEDKVIHIHGRFSIVTAPGEDDPCLKVDVHHFVIMHANDSATPNSDPTPLDVRASVTLCGQVTSITNVANDGSANKFFMLEVSDYVRDRVQTFHIRFVSLSPFPLRHSLTNFHRCRLNNSNKRWEKTPLPANGSTVLISGFLCGESARELLVEVETMQFIAQARVSEVGRSPQMPGSSKFGTPKRLATAEQNIFLC